MIDRQRFKDIAFSESKIETLDFLLIIKYFKDKYPQDHNNDLIEKILSKYHGETPAVQHRRVHQVASNL
jgi:hypothetical protein